MATKTKAPEKTEIIETARLRIRLRAYDHKVLDTSCRQIVETAIRFNVKIRGPIP